MRIRDGTKYSIRDLFAGLLLVSVVDAKKNIVLVMADDHGYGDTGFTGHPFVKTPNLDAIAQGGLLFNRAYCQQAICRPSRASLMTGMRPESTGLFHNYDSLRELQPDILTLPEHLIANGYETVSLGKIFHQGDTDEGRSWSRTPRSRFGKRRTRGSPGTM